MASKIKVDQIEGSTGSSITIPSGQTLTITDGLASSTITSGTLADARIPNLNASKITAGTIATARLGSGTASSSTFLRGDGTFAAAGGGVLQIKTGSRTTSGSYNSNSGYSNWGCSVTITPTASNSSFWINANIFTGVSHNDVVAKWNVSDSQVSSTAGVFSEPSFGQMGHLGGVSYAGIGSFAASGSADDYILYQVGIGGMYTPSSNNANARTFNVIAYNSTEGTLRVNESYSSGRAGAGVSTIEVWEIANGIYS